jgi:hypothetical protein
MGGRRLGRLRRQLRASARSVGVTRRSYPADARCKRVDDPESFDQRCRIDIGMHIGRCFPPAGTVLSRVLRASPVVRVPTRRGGGREAVRYRAGHSCHVGLRLGGVHARPYGGRGGGVPLGYTGGGGERAAWAANCWIGVAPAAREAVAAMGYRRFGHRRGLRVCTGPQVEGTEGTRQGGAAVQKVMSRTTKRQLPARADGRVTVT